MTQQRLATCFLSLLIALSVNTLHAQHIEFPPELQELVNDQIPLGSVPIGASVPGFSDDIGTAFSFLDTNNGAAINQVLCYPLAANSISGELETGFEVEMNGVVFVYCPGTIDISSDSQFLLFFQQVKPDITSVFSIQSQTIDLQMTTEQAVSENYAEYCFFDSEFFDCLAPACENTLNNLQSQNPPLICLAGCCGFGAEFRLPGIQYEKGGSPFAVFTFVNEFDFTAPDFRQFFRHYSFFTGIADDPKLEPFFSFQQFEIPLYQPGDTNRDGNIDLLDVAGFLDCLTDGTYVFQCDINRDLAVNLLDVAPFVELLSN